MSDRNKEIGEKIELLGQVGDVKNGTRARRSRIAENIAAVAENVKENPGLSIPRRSSELGIPQTSLHRILHRDLGLKVNTRTQAMWHTSKETINLLREKFPDLVISRRGHRDLVI